MLFIFDLKPVIKLYFHEMKSPNNTTKFYNKKSRKTDNVIKA